MASLVIPRLVRVSSSNLALVSMEYKRNTPQKQISTKASKTNQHDLAQTKCPFQGNISHEIDDNCDQHKGRTPPGPRSLPLIGTIYKYLPFVGSYSRRNQQRTDTLRYEQYGPVVREEVFPGQVMYYIYDPELFSQVLHQESKYPTRFAMEGVKAYRESRGQHPGFPNSFGEEWYKIRQPVNQLMLRPNAISAYLSKQDEVAKSMIDLICVRRDGVNEVEGLQDILYRFGMESVGTVIFDTRLGTLADKQQSGSETERFVSATNVAFDKMYDTTFFWPLHKNKKTKTWKSLEASFDFISGLTEKYISDCIKRTENGEVQETNFLQSLVSRSKLDFNQVSSILCDLFYAGVDTVAYTIAFSMYHLAKYPETQAKLYDEISRITPTAQNITSQQLNEMKYLKATVKETLRLTPVSAFGVARTFDKDIKVAGYHIPARSFVFLQPNVLARSADYFPDPDIFNPERWLVKDGSTRKTFPLMSFGYGGRMCAGKRFAEQEIYLGLINLLSTFRIEYHHEDIGMETRFLNQPNKPLRFALIDRKT